MFKLLNAEFKTLLAWEGILYVIALTLIIGIFCPGINILNESPTLDGCFTFPFVVLAILSTFLGLFTYRDYSQNTIRNKIVVGNSRASIYFAKSLLVVGTMFVLMMLFLGVNVLIGWCFGDISYIECDVFINNCFMILISTLVIASFTSLTSICIQSPIGAMLPLMFMMSSMFACTIMFEMFTINENKFMIELFQTLPVVSLITLSETVQPFDLIVTTVYGLAMTLVLQLSGFAIFKKTDLK